MHLQEFLQAVQEGRFVAIYDHTDREDETDLVIAAEKITPEQMAFLIRYTSGIITVPMKKERLAELDLFLLETDNPANFGTPFTLSVDLKSKTRGGVSAVERVATVRALIDPQTKPKELGRPGHVFPLQAHPGGLRARQGHTEAALQLVEWAHLYPAAVIGELMNDDGSMMRGPQLEQFLLQHHIPLCSIADLIEETSSHQ